VGGNNSFLLHGDMGSSSGAGGASGGRGSLDDLLGSELVTESSMLGTEGLHSSVVSSSSSAEVAESDHSDVLEVSGSAHSSQASGMGTSSGVVLSTSVEGHAFGMSTFTGKVSFPSSKGGHSLVVGSAFSMESSQVSAMSGVSSGVVGSNFLEVGGSLSSGSGKSLGMSTSVGVVSSASVSGQAFGVSAFLGVVSSQAVLVSSSSFSEDGLHSASVSGHASGVRLSGFPKVAHLGTPSLVHFSLLAHPVLAHHLV